MIRRDVRRSRLPVCSQGRGHHHGDIHRHVCRRDGSARLRFRDRKPRPGSFPGVAADSVFGGDGNDSIGGGGGNDSLDGYYGNDTVIGGAGHDIIDGGINGAYDNDRLEGGDGNDTIFGQDLDTILASGARQRRPDRQVHRQGDRHRAGRILRG